jgi:two-component system KDP operon response regulator KdpE
MTADRILVCDPNPQIQRALRVILREAGYQVLTTGSGTEALACVARERPRAVILELALPDLDGIGFCRWLRHYGQMPILVLSAVDQESTKIQALESGADDYVTKPFSSGELLARLAARLRAAPSELRFDIDGLVIDLPAHLVTIDGEAVHLTATEFALLRVLATSRGTVTHRVLAAGVWGSLRGDVMPRIRAHIMHLRVKLDRGRRSSVIRTEPGIGYRFVGDGPRRSVPGTPASGSAGPSPNL